MQLIIGNQNYSSWSLRAWLLLAAFDVPFATIKESLRQEQLKERLANYSPTSRVPVLIDEHTTVWDSLAICEYVSEKYLAGKGWPANITHRARARAICSEMHAGFNGLRSELPMNCRATRKVEPSESALSDIARIEAIWSECLSEHGGPWLFKDFSIADCFYAPVVLRFKTYGISLSPSASQYQAFFLQDNILNRWVAAGKAETEIVPEDEAGVDR